MKDFRKKLRHFFLPSEKNNYRARLLHLDVMLVLIIMTSIYTFGIKGLSAGQILGIATDITTERLFELTNKQRVANGLSPLKYNEQLAAAARNKARDMFEKDYWAHYAQDGTTPWSFILAAGYKYKSAGENLAHGFLFSDQVVEAWMQSQTHRENLLRANYQDIGFAIVNGTLKGEPTTLVVQFFGSPAAETRESNTAIAKAKEPEETSAIQGQQAETQNQVSAPGTVVGNATFNISSVSFNTSLIILGLLLIALVSDLIYAYKMKLLRVTSKNIAHMIFLAVIVVSVMMLTKGVIL
ncbi:MAG: CAP domain-containing protein [Candidatus Paceibacterota bacterium]